MLKAKLALILLLMLPATAMAGGLGTVTKILRPQVHTFDAKGQPSGTLNAADIKTPAPILALGLGGSIGVGHAGKTVYLRGLDVQTQGLNATCKPVQSAARTSGSAYAATNMGLGGAADCQRAH
ncbi:MAG TPA: hypothetical protein VGG29_03370 [Caulobacteraceae bacterium]|jgi:hypothetical protein